MGILVITDIQEARRLFIPKLTAKVNEFIVLLLEGNHYSLLENTISEQPKIKSAIMQTEESVLLSHNQIFKALILNL